MNDTQMKYISSNEEITRSERTTMMCRKKLWTIMRCTKPRDWWILLNLSWVVYHQTVRDLGMSHTWPFLLQDWYLSETSLTSPQTLKMSMRDSKSSLCCQVVDDFGRIDNYSFWTFQCWISAPFSLSLSSPRRSPWLAGDFLMIEVPE